MTMCLPYIPRPMGRDLPLARVQPDFVAVSGVFNWEARCP